MNFCGLLKCLFFFFGIYHRYRRMKFKAPTYCCVWIIQCSKSKVICWVIENINKLSACIAQFELLKAPILNQIFHFDTIKIVLMVPSHVYIYLEAHSFLLLPSITTWNNLIIQSPFVSIHYTCCMVIFIYQSLYMPKTNPLPYNSENLWCTLYMKYIHTVYIFRARQLIL